MPGLRWSTAGESHGPMLVGILDGLPAGLPLTERDLMPMMRRRQGGHGRGKRMSIEPDAPRIVAGLWKGRTNGAPLAMLIENRSNRQGRTQVRKTRPRPGHADLAGMLKYGFNDANPVIERASARETAMRTALGAAAAHFLGVLGVRLTAHVVEIGGIAAPERPVEWGPDDIVRRARRSPVACCNARAGKAMAARIDEASERGESLGGRVEVVAWGLPPGLGSYAQWDRRLDGRLAQALASIPSVKGVELGDALAASRSFGREAHDPIVNERGRIARTSNRAGGLEGGVTNGEPLVARLVLKPIPTQRRPLPTIDLDTGEPVDGRYVRSDTAVLPAAGVVAEAVCALVLGGEVLDKFGGDALEDVAGAIEAYRARLPRWDGA